MTFPVVSAPFSCPLDGFCQNLVNTLENTPGLRYVWSSFKPLLQGKVLYTPDTPAARLLVKEVKFAKKDKSRAPPNGAKRVEKEGLNFLFPKNGISRRSGNVGQGNPQHDGTQKYHLGQEIKKKTQQFNRKPGDQLC